MKIRLIISGKNYHLMASIPDQLDLPDKTSVDEALQQLTELLEDETALSPSCLVAVSNRHLGTVANHEPCRLRDGDELVIITPVAGG